MTWSLIAGKKPSVSANKSASKQRAIIIIIIIIIIYLVPYSAWGYVPINPGVSRR